MTGNDSTIQLVSTSVEQTMAIAETVAKAATPGDLVGLIGELGAGKTQFVRGMAVGLGISPRKVSSPTFVFLQEYPVDDTDTDSLVLVHIDAYRLVGVDDLQSIGWDGNAQELRHGAVLAVEWADRITDALGADWLEVALEHTDAGRTITLSPHGLWRDKMPVLRQDLNNITQPEQA